MNQTQNQFGMNGGHARRTTGREDGREGGWVGGGIDGAELGLFIVSAANL